MFWRLRARQTGVVVYTNAQKPLREVWAAYPEPDVFVDIDRPLPDCSRRRLSHGRHRSRDTRDPVDRSAYFHQDDRPTLGRTIARMCRGRPAQSGSTVLRNCA
jgi:hypothetical protein